MSMNFGSLLRGSQPAITPTIPILVAQIAELLTLTTKPIAWLKDLVKTTQQTSLLGEYFKHALVPEISFVRT